MALLSDIRSGLLGLGSSAVDAGQSIGRGIGQGAGLLGQQLAQPLAQGIRDIPDVMRFYEAQRMAQPMMSYDPADLKPVTPMGVAGMLPTLRAAEQEAVQKPMLDALKAQADLARMRGVGSSMKHPVKYVDNETGREFVALFDEGRGKFVDPSTGNVVDSNRYSLAEGAGIKGKRMPSFGEMLSLDEKIQDDVNAIRSIKRFRKSLSEREFGIKGKIDNVTASIKTFFKGADSKLSPREFYNRLSVADQQGLLGQIRESVVGGGVMTEFDAIRVLERMGGDVGSIMRASPQVFGRATKDIMDDIYRKAERRIMFYNEGAERHRFNPINLDALISDIDDVTLGDVSDDPMGIR